MIRTGLVFILLLLANFTHAMTSMTNDELDAVTGQALIVLEQIKGQNVTSGLGQGDWSNFTYTRMGLDAKISLNSNIDKLQLGCGGFNEVIRTGCDIDLDYVRFMGRTGTNPCTVSTDATNPCYGGGDFVLTRPYIEIATKGSGATREVVGIKIGAQQADGYMAIGRTYAVGDTNLENSGTCGTADGAPALACHSGINVVSGFLRTEISAQVPITVLGSNELACFGNTSSAMPSDACGAADAYYRDIVGTRQNQLLAPSTQLKMSGGFLSWLGLSKGYANVTEALRFIHGFAMANTNDFFLSFQREKVAYPGYLKTAASYAYPANAGWWMNVPDVKALDIAGPHRTLGFFEALDTLGEPGVPLTNIELNSVAPSNCWGSSKFC